MSLWKIFLAVGLAFVLVSLVMIVPTGPEEDEISYTLEEMDAFQQREEFQRKALAFHEEVRDRVVARIAELSRPYVAPGHPESPVDVDNIMSNEMPKWAHDELLRRGETEESITEEKGWKLLQTTPAWTEMTELQNLLNNSRQLPEVVGADTFLPHAEEWLAEFREDAIRLRVLEKDAVASATE